MVSPQEGHTSIGVLSSIWRNGMRDSAKRRERYRTLSHRRLDTGPLSVIRRT